MNYQRALEAAEDMGLDLTLEIPRFKTLEALYYWELFSTLSRTRLYSDAGPQAISILELTCYLSEEGITHPDQRQDAIFFVMYLDDLYRDHVAAKAKADRDKKRRGRRGR